MLSRYDADETTYQTAPAVGAPVVSDPVSPDVPAQPSGATAIQSVEGYGNESESALGAYQAPPHEGGYQNGGGFDPGFHNQATAPAGDSEPQGTGIKEDG